MPEKAGVYSEEFFDNHRKNSAIYTILVQLFSKCIVALDDNGVGKGMKDVSVLDVGCGHGLLVEAWRSAGITKSFCMEGSSNASHMWPPQHKDEFYVVQDFEAPEAGTVVQATDFVTSFEVADHLP